MSHITYEGIKLLAEVVAFGALTPGVFMLFNLRKTLSMHFGRNTSNMLLTGVVIFWAGYLTNVLNDVFPLPPLKILDDVLVAAGLTWIIVYGRHVYGKLTVKAKPAKLLNGAPTLHPDGYLVPLKIPVEEVVRILEGWKLLAVTRDPQPYKKANIPALWLTKIEGENRVHPTKLAPLLQYLIDQANGDTAVILDGVEYLILENGFEGVFKFLTNLKDHLVSRGSVLLLRVDPESLGEREAKILEREFTWLSEAGRQRA